MVQFYNLTIPQFNSSTVQQFNSLEITHSLENDFISAVSFFYNLSKLNNSISVIAEIQIWWFFRVFFASLIPLKKFIKCEVSATISCPFISYPFLIFQPIHTKIHFAKLTIKIDWFPSSLFFHFSDYFLNGFCWIFFMYCVRHHVYF